jgi:hypothetical protein
MRKRNNAFFDLARVARALACFYVGTGKSACATSVEDHFHIGTLFEVNGVDEANLAIVVGEN